MRSDAEGDGAIGLKAEALATASAASAALASLGQPQPAQISPDLLGRAGLGAQLST